jgi:hypothetical protein
MTSCPLTWPVLGILQFYIGLGLGLYTGVAYCWRQSQCRHWEAPAKGTLLLPRATLLTLGAPLPFLTLLLVLLISERRLVGVIIM